MGKSQRLQSREAGPCGGFLVHHHFQRQSRQDLSFLLWSSNGGQLLWQEVMVWEHYFHLIFGHLLQVFRLQIEWRSLHLLAVLLKRPEGREHRLL